MVHSGVYSCGIGPSVITFHSSLSSGRQWLPLSSQLKQEYTFFHFDLLRYGKAPTLAQGQSYRFSQEIARVQWLIEKEKIIEPIHIVGHSCGGAVALKFAVEHPHLVRSLTLFEPVAFHLLEKGTKFRALADKFAQDVASHDSEQAAEIFTNFWNDNGFYRTLPQKVQQLMAKDMASVNQDFEALTAETYGEEALALLSFPTMILTGEQSPELGQFLAKHIAQMIPAARLKTLPVGHMGPVNKADIVQPEIAAFIKEVDSYIGDKRIKKAQL